MFEQLSPEPIYNTRAVVQRTSVPADTFRAWERRYGVPHPSRTAGNQRLYSERDIATISWLRDQTNTGLTISQAVALLFTRSRGLRHQPKPSALESIDTDARPTTDTPPRTSPLDELRRSLVETLIRLDGNTADRLVEEAFALTNVENVCLDVLQAALSEIGERWEHGSANVAVEHFASAYVQRKLGALFNQSNPSEGRGPLVAACPEGELHEIGLLLTSVFLSRRGFNILYLGANLPLPDLVATVERVQPPLVLLSAAREESAVRIRVSAPCLKRAVRNPHGRDLPEIGYGGHVFRHRPDLCTAIDGVFLGADAREAAASVEHLFSSLTV